MQFLWKNQNAHNMHSALHWKPFFKVPGLPWNYVSSDVAIACIYGRQFISKIKCMIKYAIVNIFIITEIIKVLLKAFGKMDWDWTWYFWVLKESAEFHCPSMLNRILLVWSILWDFQRSKEVLRCHKTQLCCNYNSVKNNADNKDTHKTLSLIHIWRCRRRG